MVHEVLGSNLCSIVNKKNSLIKSK
jgi:hypothetical protein